MADMGVTETSATGLALVAAMVQSQLIVNAELMFTIQDESARAVKGAKSIAFPKTGALDPTEKAENTATTAQVLTYAVDTMNLDQHFQTLVRLEDIAAVQSILNVESDIIERAGKGMAKKYDTAIYTALKASASASAPDHTVADYAASGAITRAKILANRKLLNDQNVPKSERFMVISTEQESELLNIDGFVDADKYGSRESLLNGEIGRLFGFTVICTTTCESDVTLYYHRSALAFARQVEPTWERQRADLAYLADDYSLSSLFGVKAMDAGKRIVVASAS